jgi:hypothetical protein
MAAVGSTNTQFDGTKKLIVSTTLMPTEAAGEFTFTIDVSALNNQRFPAVSNSSATAIPCVSLSLQRIWYSVSVAAKADSVSIVGDATADLPYITLDGNGSKDFTMIGGIHNPALGTGGSTGDVIIRSGDGTTATTVGDSISIHMEWLKNY